MTTSTTDFSVVWFVDSKVKILAKENNRPKVYEGTISDIDSQSNTLSLTLNITLNKARLQVSNILNCELSDEFFSRAIATSRFASSFDANGNQQWNLHTSPNSIPDSAGLPPAPESESESAQSKPSVFTPGQYQIGNATIGSPINVGQMATGQIVIMDEAMLITRYHPTTKSITLHVTKS